MKSNPADTTIHRAIPESQTTANHPIDLFSEESQRGKPSGKAKLPGKDLWDPWDKRNLPSK
ncbi:MAG TPA: hypothetical protein HPQ00_02625 [Magnetococcales bacterium]|nr:hypothetical protein [Magnetococcales bacterium]